MEHGDVLISTVILTGALSGGLCCFAEDFVLRSLKHRRWARFLKQNRILRTEQKVF